MENGFLKTEPFLDVNKRIKQDIYNLKVTKNEN